MGVSGLKEKSGPKSAFLFYNDLASASGSPDSAANQTQHKQHQEYEEKYFSDSCCSRSYSTESKYTGDNSYNQKYYGPSKHN
jgi:hypothetical protein